MYSTKYKPRFILFPLAGIILFIILYIIATFLYPGGSQFDKNARGFSWLHNFWCNLLNEHAINGAINKAQPFAIAGMIVLAVSLIWFWLLFSLLISTHKRLNLFVQATGFTAMLTSLLLFTEINHDLITNLSSLLGILAVTGTFILLYKKRWTAFLYFGYFNLFLIALNNFCYYTPGYIYYLPIIQKITFLAFLSWMALLCLHTYNKQQSFILYADKPNTVV